jgi:hypothetical protein
MSEEGEVENNDSNHFALVLSDSDIKIDGPDDKYIIDSGASINVFTSLKSIEGMVILAIEELLPTDSSCQLSGIAGKSLKPTHRGHIQGIGMLLVVPNAVHNLISVSQLMSMGIYEIQFGDHGCIIKYKNNSEYIFKIPNTNANMYVANKMELLEMSIDLR